MNYSFVPFLFSVYGANQKKALKTIALKYTLIFAAPLCFSIITKAQKRTENFEISIPEIPKQGCLYNHIALIDSRPDTTFFGIVQKGGFNAKAKVVAEKPLAEQLEYILAAFSGTSVNKGTLLLHLRQFSLAEVTGAFSEKGYCYARADLYALENEKYTLINTFDSVLLSKGFDVTKSLMRTGSNFFTQFIAEALTKEPPKTNRAFTYYEITKMDSIEKRAIPLYNTSNYTEGLYLTYESFKNQQPDQSITVKEKNGKLKSIKSIDKKGPYEVSPEAAYAIVYNNQPYIAGLHKFELLRKEDDDFYFRGKGKTQANTGAVIASSVFFGLIGGLIAASATSEATFEFKLDHRNGGQIILQERKKSSN